VIRQITEETGTSIDIENDGTVKIASVQGAAGREAQRRIELITADVEVGRIYEARSRAHGLRCVRDHSSRPRRAGAHIAISESALNAWRQAQGRRCRARQGTRGGSSGACAPIHAQRRRSLECAARWA